MSGMMSREAAESGLGIVPEYFRRLTPEQKADLIQRYNLNSRDASLPARLQAANEELQARFENVVPEPRPVTWSLLNPDTSSAGVLVGTKVPPSETPAPSPTIPMQAMQKALLKLHGIVISIPILEYQLADNDILVLMLPKSTDTAILDVNQQLRIDITVDGNTYNCTYLTSFSTQGIHCIRYMLFTVLLKPDRVLNDGATNHWNDQPIPAAEAAAAGPELQPDRGD